MSDALPVMVLAGTSEAAELIRRLARTPEFAVTASYAGRTQRSPGDEAVRERTGGFGGVDGLVAELQQAGHRALVDATHPFAARMPHAARAAAERLGVPRLRLLRPPWTPVPGDEWHDVADLTAAAARLDELGARRVLLTTGRMELEPFAASAAAGTAFVVRSISTPVPQPLRGATVLLERGPYAVDDEEHLLREHRIDTVVTKNSGATATAAKLTAARRLGVRVVMVGRPPVPAGPCVPTVDDALAWLHALARPAARP